MTLYRFQCGQQIYLLHWVAFSYDNATNHNVLIHFIHIHHYFCSISRFYPIRPHLQSSTAHRCHHQTWLNKTVLLSAYKKSDRRSALTFRAVLAVASSTTPSERHSHWHLVSTTPDQVYCNIAQWLQRMLSVFCRKNTQPVQTSNSSELWSLRLMVTNKPRLLLVYQVNYSGTRQNAHLQ